MSTKLYIRKNKGKAKINLRYRPNRNTSIVLATPFLIEADKWDSINEMYDLSFKKKNPKTDIDKIQNRTIDEFNIKLNEFKTSLDSFIVRNNYNIDNSKLKSFLANHYGTKEKKNLKKKFHLLY